MELLMEANLLAHLWEFSMEPNYSAQLKEAQLLEHPWEFSMELLTVGMSAQLLSGILKVQGS